MKAWMLVGVAGLAWAQEATPAADEMERQQAREMLAVRRVYVDRLSGGQNSGTLRDMVIAALQRARLFIVTEDESRADAYLRGAAEDLIYSDVRAVREGLQVRGSTTARQRDRAEADAVAASVAVSEQDDRYTRERKHEAVAALRLVARNGDVLWSTTQESLGAKYKGSSADVAEKVTRELEGAFARARKVVGQGSAR